MRGLRLRHQRLARSDKAGAEIGKVGAQHPRRAAELLEDLDHYAYFHGAPIEFRQTTPYINTIAAEDQPEYPGDLELERKIRNINRWNAAMSVDMRYPMGHEAFLERCHAAGQGRPTPLLLRYGPGDYNCLHQDLYGEHVFPLQATVLLSQPGDDFVGGEFVLTEQRPRMQSRAEVVPLSQGCAVIFPVHHRPVQGTRGVYRVNMRHGVSRIRDGQRHTLGVIFHDAK